jgi:hypothetical protein
MSVLDPATQRDQLRGKTRALIAAARKIKALADGEAAKIHLHTDIPCVGCELDDALDAFDGEGPWLEKAYSAK